MKTEFTFALVLHSVWSIYSKESSNKQTNKRQITFESNFLEDPFKSSCDLLLPAEVDFDKNAHYIRITRLQALTESQLSPRPCSLYKLLNFLEG